MRLKHYTYLTFPIEYMAVKILQKRIYQEKLRKSIENIDMPIKCRACRHLSNEVTSGYVYRRVATSISHNKCTVWREPWSASLSIRQPVPSSLMRRWWPSFATLQDVDVSGILLFSQVYYEVPNYDSFIVRITVLWCFFKYFMSY